MSWLDRTKRRLLPIAALALMGSASVGCDAECDAIVMDLVACECELAQCRGEPDAAAICESTETNISAAVSACSIQSAEEKAALEAERDAVCATRDSLCP